MISIDRKKRGAIQAKSKIFAFKAILFELDWQVDILRYQVKCSN